MKISKILLPLFLVVALIFPLRASAQTFSGNQKIVTLRKDETVNQDYFAGGNTVILDGTVNGDTYIGGGQIEVNGYINGDLLIAGGQVTVLGTVTQDVRVMGGNVIVEGNVGKNVSEVGGNLTIDKDAKIGGNAVLAGGEIAILAPVRNLTVAGGNVRLESKTLGNVNATTGNLALLPGAVINGNLEYWSGQKAAISSGASIEGKTIYHRVVSSKTKDSVSKAAFPITGVSLFFSAIAGMASLLLGLTFLAFFPFYSSQTAAIVANKFWLSLLIGFVSIILAPIASLILFVTLIGFPLGVVLIFEYGISLFIAKVFVAIAAGKYMVRKFNWKMNSYWAFIVGLILYYAIGIIPLIGSFAKLTVMLCGLGAIVIGIKNYYTTLSTKKLI